MNPKVTVDNVGFHFIYDNLKRIKILRFRKSQAMSSNSQHSLSLFPFKELSFFGCFLFSLRINSLSRRNEIPLSEITTLCTVCEDQVDVLLNFSFLLNFFYYYTSQLNCELLCMDFFTIHSHCIPFKINSRSVFLSLTHSSWFYVVNEQFFSFVLLLLSAKEKSTQAMLLHITLDFQFRISLHADASGDIKRAWVKKNIHEKWNRKKFMPCPLGIV